MAKKQPHATPSMLTTSWPEEGSADPAVEAARRFVVNLYAAIGRSVARDGGGQLGDDPPHSVRRLGGRSSDHLKR